MTLKNTPQHAAMLWTGGKDSALALHEAHDNGYPINCLVTFAPPQADFLAHPLDVIKLQAQALALPHHVLVVEPPFEQSYESGLRKLKQTFGIDCVITGDIAEVAGNPNWISERSHPVGLTVYTPLWGRDRGVLLRQLLDKGIKARISCVNTHWLTFDWVGRILDDAAMAELLSISKQNGLDLCGENGEYHTMVVDGPMFQQSIAINSYATHNKDALRYMEIHQMELKNQHEIEAINTTSSFFVTD